MGRYDATTRIFLMFMSRQLSRMAQPQQNLRAARLSFSTFNAATLYNMLEKFSIVGAIEACIIGSLFALSRSKLASKNALFIFL